MKTSGRTVGAPTQTQVRSFTLEPVYLVLIEILILETLHPTYTIFKSRWRGESHRLRNTALELLIFHVSSQVAGLWTLHFVLQAVLSRDLVGNPRNCFTELNFRCSHFHA
jgi:hypothetical protein